MDCANRICRGESLPIEAFSGLPLADLADVTFCATVDAGSAHTPKAITIEPFFIKRAQWKQKPSLDMALRILAMESASLVDESSIWRAEINRANRLCDQVMAIPTPSRANWNAVCTSTAQVDALVAAL